MNCTLYTLCINEKTKAKDENEYKSKLENLSKELEIKEQMSERKTNL